MALDTSLTLRDEGVSGFTGKHRANPDRNALAAFLKLVEKGRRKGIELAWSALVGGDAALAAALQASTAE